jgi:hypothetical protein
MIFYYFKIPRYFSLLSQIGARKMGIYELKSEIFVEYELQKIQ